MKRRNLKYILVLSFIWQISIIPNSYFVDAEKGNDNNLGVSPNQAWKSMNKVNNSLFSPGDSILLKTDCVWREELLLSSSGLPNNLIVLSSYGEGNPPVILGSDLITQVNEISPNVWESKFVQSLGWLWFIDSDEEIIWGTKKNNRNELIGNYDFYSDSTSVFFYCEDSLLNTKIKVEASVRDFGIISGWYKQPNNYVKIENLEICFTKNANIRNVGGSGWLIENITSHHSGAIDESDGQGIQIEGKDNLVSSCTIYENGQHGIFISSFGNHSVSNNIVEQNVVYNNYHTGIDLMNDGGEQNSHSHTFIRRNLIYDESNFIGTEIGIQTLGYGNGHVKNVTIHHNILKDINGIGISIASNSDSIFIHNNTIYETKSACVSLANKNGFTELYNNIGVNNYYYAVLFLHQTSNKMLDHNIWFSNTKSSTKNIYSKNNYYDSIEVFRDKIGLEKNGSFSDPNLYILNNNVIGLKVGSPGIDSGKKLNYTLDYFENDIKGNIDMGAVEYIK